MAADPSVVCTRSSRFPLQLYKRRRRRAAGIAPPPPAAPRAAAQRARTCEAGHP
jgi:hypothetical protein